MNELAPRPLLLTLMASLHAWRGGSLPGEREQLYDESVELLLDIWERPKLMLDEDGEPVLQAASAAEWLRSPQSDIKKALEKLAYTAHRSQEEPQGAADIEEGQLVGALMTAAKDEDLKPARVLEYIRDRAGLLSNKGEGVYSFPHRTFQEYMAARHLTVTDFPSLLVKLVKDDPERWREVMLLAGAKVARGTPYAAWSLVDYLCPQECGDERAKSAPDSDWWAALLAGQLLVDTGIYQQAASDSPDAHKLARVRSWLMALVSGGRLPPVDRALAGRALGWIGDKRPGVGVVNGVPDIVWCEVEAGPFVMGSADGETNWDNETPQFICNLVTEPFRISRYPVTVAQYQAFVADGGYQTERYWTVAKEDGEWFNGQVKRRYIKTIGDDSGGLGEVNIASRYIKAVRSDQELVWEEEVSSGPVHYNAPFDTPNHPQVGISWYEAVAYCNWLSELLGYPVRLPTEAEWERASRHTDGRIYPWGNKFDAQRCNMSKTGIGGTCAVGIFPGGDAECCAADLSGNVWEWCVTKWQPNYSEYEAHVDDALGGGEGRLLRGGAFFNSQNGVRCAYRGDHGWQSNYRGNGSGFRLCTPGL